MAPKIVLTGATGKIGNAILNALFTYDLVSYADLVIATSSDSNHPRLDYASQKVEIRESNYESVESMVHAFAGCDRLFLVSTPHIDLDFDNAAKGGREVHHFNAFEAARRAGIKHVYYTSLAFSDPSKAAVMRAHLKTEEFLKSQKDFAFTIIREGIYSESWPLYLGHFKIPDDDRSTMVIGPDGPISWTAIQDLGLANALILTSNDQEWAGKTIYLSTKRALRITDIAELVGKVRNKQLTVDIRSQQQYIEYYTEERKMDQSRIKWWSSTYPALQDGECQISESPLEDLLALKGREPTSVEKIIVQMFSNSRVPYLSADNISAT